MMMIIAGLSNSKELAEKIAKKLNVDFDDLHLRDSADGELHVKFNHNVKNQKVVLVQSLHPYPNHSLFEVLYAAGCARDLGAKEIIYVAPYIAFFREDNRKEKGECIQQNIVADLLNRNVDKVIAVEPHLHQHNLSGKLFSIPFYNLKCGELLRKYVKENFSGCKVIGFGERAQNLAKHADNSAAVYKKNERAEYSDDVLLIDDIISSGDTMLDNIKNLNLKPGKINVLAVHGLFNEDYDAYKKLKGKVNKIVSCNTINHETNRIDVSDLIAAKLMVI